MEKIGNQSGVLERTLPVGQMWKFSYQRQRNMCASHMTVTMQDISKTSILVNWWDTNISVLRMDITSVVVLNGERKP